jgi:hypothetical protein
MQLAAAGRTYHVLDRLAVGSITTLYRCRDRHREVIFKVARDPCTNDLLANEAQVLHHLIGADVTGRFSPFLTQVEASLAVGDPTAGEPRQAAILRMDDRIHSPDELFTLAEIRAHYPAGVDPRHVAWIWRRLLTILGFAHTSDVVHAAVLPEHVLIEPREHKLLLIDWCCAVINWQHNTAPVALTAGYRDWYACESALRQPPTPGLDVALAARCMIELLGGDPVSADFPTSTPPGLQRHFTRCLARRTADARQLLNDFDRLIEALWGPRKFMELHMPPKRRANDSLLPNAN